MCNTRKDNSRPLQGHEMAKQYYIPSHHHHHRQNHQHLCQLLVSQLGQIQLKPKQRQRKIRTNISKESFFFFFKILLNKNFNFALIGLPAISICPFKLWAALASSSRANLQMWTRIFSYKKTRKQVFKAIEMLECNLLGQNHSLCNDQSLDQQAIELTPQSQTVQKPSNHISWITKTLWTILSLK